MKAKGSKRAVQIDPLSDLAKRINAQHELCSKALQDGLRHALNAGQLLLEAKEQVPHGQWISWLESHCDFALRTAQAYMKAAREVPQLDEAKAQRVALLPFRKAMLELAEGATAEGKEAEERQAALKMLDNKPVEKIVRMIEQGGTARASLLPAAAEHGFASDGKFLARLTADEQQQLQQLPMTEEYRAPDFQAVMPKDQDFKPLRLVGCVELPSDTFSTFDNTIEKVGVLTGAEDTGILLLVDWNRFKFLRERYPDAVLAATGKKGVCLVVFRTENRIDGLLMSLDKWGDVPRTPQGFRSGFCSALDAMRQVCEEIAGKKRYASRRDEDRRLKAIVQAMAVLNSAVERLKGISFPAPE